MTRATDGTRREATQSDMLQLLERGRQLHNEAIYAVLAGMVKGIAGLVRGGGAAAAEAGAPTGVGPERGFAGLAGQDR